MIDKLNNHYSMTNPASVYDEESLTALELAGRTTGKVNEVVDAQNQLKSDTEKHLSEQDANIEKIRTVTVPADVSKEVQKQIDNGTFDSQIDKSLNNLNTRVDNLLGSLKEGSTTGDAELIDARVNANGVTLDNAGDNTRESYNALSNRMNNVSFYSLDLVKQMGEFKPIFESDLECKHTDATKTWKFVTKKFNAPPGVYTLIIDDCFMSSVGWVCISHTAEGHKFTDLIKKAGVYVFKLYDVQEGYTERTITLQVSNETTVETGLYYARGIHIYNGDVTNLQLLPDYITGAENRVKKIYSKNLFDKSTITSGVYVNYDGQVIPESPQYPGYFASDYIPVEAGKKYAFTLDYVGGAFIGFYSSKGPAIQISGGSFCTYNQEALDECGWVVTAPNNAKWVRISGQNPETAQVEQNDTQSPYEPYSDYLPLTLLEEKVKRLSVNTDILKHNTPYMIEKSVLSSGGSMSVTTPNSRGGHTISFTGDITGFDGQLVISNGKTNPYCSSYLVLTNSELKVYFYTTSAVLKNTVAHSLTLNENIIVDVNVFYDTAKVRITSAGQTFETTVEWKGSVGNIMVESTGVTVNNAILSSFIHNFNKNIWVYGDSYIDYWCETVDGYGYKNFMIDGFSGRNSLTALSSFTSALEKATPKKVLWCMGMNDVDGDSSVNTNWLTAFNTLKNKCEELNIELIVSTVPTTPTRNNNFKNDVVRSSGLRVVDVAKAVGSHISNSWYSELLSGDNVHPSEKGQIVIANYILANVPELKGD